MEIAEEPRGATVNIVTLETENGKLTKRYLDNLREVVNSPWNPVRYLAIDPGESNGVCGYDEKFHPQFMLTIKHEDMTKFLDCFNLVHTCILEDYRVFAHKAQAHITSKLVTTRVIGRVEAWADLKNIRIFKQGSDIKKTGYAWVGKKPLPKSNPQNHSLDAHIHFIYWAVRAGKIDAKTLL